MSVSRAVEIGDEFEPEFDELHEDVRAEILALALIRKAGDRFDAHLATIKREGR